MCRDNPGFDFAPSARDISAIRETSQPGKQFDGWLSLYLRT